MSELLYTKAAFNDDISKWNTASVSRMDQMFQQASAFNGDISSWNTASVTTMSSTFSSASAFSRNLASWNVKSVTAVANAFESTGLDSCQKRALYSKWVRRCKLRTQVSQALLVLHRRSVRS